MLRSASTGKMAPINAEPDPNGNILIDAERGEYHIVKKAARTVDMVLHTNHFVDCPAADSWHATKRGR
jgi:hypothetical protein